MSVEIIKNSSPVSQRTSPISSASSSSSLSEKIDSPTDRSPSPISPSRVSTVSLDSDKSLSDSSKTQEKPPVRFWSYRDPSVSDDGSSSPHSSQSSKEDPDLPDLIKRPVVFHHQPVLSTDESFSSKTLDLGKKTDSAPVAKKSRIQKVREFFKKEKKAKTKSPQKSASNSETHPHPVEHLAKSVPNHHVNQSAQDAIVDGVISVVTPNHSMIGPAHGAFQGVMQAIMTITNIWISHKIHQKKIELLAQKQSSAPAHA